MPLFETFAAEREAVAAVVLECWGLTLDEVLKVSQNITYAAHDVAGAKLAVRAAPARHRDRIRDELTCVHWLATEGGLAGVCAPVYPRGVEPAAAEGAGVTAGEATVSVCRWAQGTLLPFASFRWMTDPDIVTAWGAWLASMHVASRAFVSRHPDVAARIRAWDEVHESVMAGVPLHPDDVAVMADPAHFGILHGDANISNFHVLEAPPAPPTLSVFDWDQLQRGWYEWDMAQCMLTSYMLAEGGSLPAGDPVPEAQPEVFKEHFVRGYESVTGVGSVDQARLARMVKMRKLFYKRFCERAKSETIPPDMSWFIEYVLRWVAKEEARADTTLEADVCS